MFIAADRPKQVVADAADELNSAVIVVVLRQLAQVWLDAASKLDGMPPTRTRSVSDAA